MEEKTIIDVDTEVINDDVLFELNGMMSDNMEKAKNAETPEEAMKYLSVVKAAKDIAEEFEDQEPEKEERWLNKPISNKQFACDILKALSIPLFGLIGTLGAAKIAANSAEKRETLQIEGRRQLLKEVMRIEETDVVNKHEIDVLNSFK